MLRSMTARDLEMWQAYYELEPSFDQRIDWLIASVVQMLHNVAAGQNHQKPIKEFLLKFERQGEPTQLTPQMQRKMFLMYLEGQSKVAED